MMTMMESGISLVRKSVEENRVSEKNEGENEEETHEGRRRSRTLCVGDISTSSRRGGIRKRTAESVDTDELKDLSGARPVKLLFDLLDLLLFALRCSVGFSSKYGRGRASRSGGGGRG
jgi:hypothetical protein